VGLERSYGQVVLIRAEEQRDRDAVAEVHRLAFAGHNGAQFVVALVEDLRASLVAEEGLSLVADDEGQILGHALFTRNRLDAPKRLVDVQVLSPVGVLPDRQRQGIGTALIEHALDVLAKRLVPLVFLEGSPDYYQRFGFTPAGEHGFRPPSLRIPDAAFQVRLLSSYEPWMTGTLVYRDAFWEHDAVGLRDPG
jgi:putative acetyltransferase